MSSAYLRLLIFLPAILIPAYASSSPAFYMRYCAYNLNKQCDNIQPWGTPFPIWNQSIVPCPVLTVASWPTYRFLREQLRCSGTPVSWRILQFAVIHTLKDFSVVNETEWVKLLSHVRLFATPWTVAYQDPQSMGFSRQEYWSGLSFPSPGDLPDPGIEPGSPAKILRQMLYRLSHQGNLYENKVIANVIS